MYKSIIEQKITCCVRIYSRSEGKNGLVWPWGHLSWLRREGKWEKYCPISTHLTTTTPISPILLILSATEAVAMLPDTSS